VAPEFNIYCDESCHLEHDKQKPMLLGCIWCPKEKVSYFSECIKGLKEQFGVRGELKWTKVSPVNLPFYFALIDWFFLEADLHFRALIVPDKSKLQYDKLEQTHDDVYYQLYFWLLNKIVDPTNTYEIYLDVKDTRSRHKVRNLKNSLCFDKFDFSGQMIQQLRSLRSSDVQLMQLADFFLGAVAYRHRGFKTSTAKLAIDKRIEMYLGFSLIAAPSPSIQKVNFIAGGPIYTQKFDLFVWQPRGEV
jgi:hypothetical protein